MRIFKLVVTTRELMKSRKVNVIDVQGEGKIGESLLASIKKHQGIPIAYTF